VSFLCGAKLDSFHLFYRKNLVLSHRRSFQKHWLVVSCIMRNVWWFSICMIDDEKRAHIPSVIPPPSSRQISSRQDGVWMCICRTLKCLNESTIIDLPHRVSWGRLRVRQPPHIKNNKFSLQVSTSLFDFIWKTRSFSLFNL
jgi:hypothetical protein